MGFPVYAIKPVAGHTGKADRTGERIEKKAYSFRNAGRLIVFWGF